MPPIVLKKQTASGNNLEATFSSENGMHLISYKKNGVEVISSSTHLSGIIGPHFSSRHVFSEIKEQSLLADLSKLNFIESSDPLPHGIGRYAPWQTTYTETKIHATLASKELWHNLPLASLEGQNFKMELKVELMASGLEMEISSISDADSLAGFECAFHLPNGLCKITSNVANDLQHQCLEISHLTPSQTIDRLFTPLPNPREAKILLETEKYRLLTTYVCNCQENCWQLHYSANESIVTIAPMSAQDPYHPNLTVSSIRVKLHILGEDNDE